MKGGKKPQLGFTVIETLIVLAVSSLIFFSVTILISGRISRTEFTEAVLDIQSKTQARINEVANGIYPNNNNITCTAAAGGPNITGAANNEGTNQGCTFIGKAIQFYVGVNPAQYNSYTIAALREVSPGVAATDLAGASPMVIAQGTTAKNSSFPDRFDTQQLENGLAVVDKLMYYNGNPANNIGTVAFISSLGTPDGNNNLESGSQQVGLYAIPTTKTKSSKLGEVNKIDNKLSTALAVNSVQVCFNSGGTNQSALMNIGTSNSNQLAVTMTIKQGLNCP